MATKDPGKRFAEQALRVERVLDSRNVNGSVGRVIFILAAANGPGGVTQKQLVEKLVLPKDAISKLVGSLVRAGLLDQIREDENSRIKRVSTTNDGEKLLAKIKVALEPPASAPTPEQPEKRRPVLWDIVAE